MNAVSLATRMWADVVVLDKKGDELRGQDRRYNGGGKNVTANRCQIEREVLEADLVIGAILVPGARASRLVNNELVARNEAGQRAIRHRPRPGRVFEDSHPTTRDNPTYPAHDS